MQNEISVKGIGTKQAGSSRVSRIALPIEHGGWGFLFEPIIAAAAVAPSIGAVWVSLFFVGAFLTRQPLKIWILGKLGGGNLRQTETAFIFVAFYGLISLIGLFGTVSLPGIEYKYILIFAGVSVFQVYCDTSGQSRRLIPELTGVMLLSFSAAAIALSSGWDKPTSLSLSGLFIARTIPSVIYVRNRLRLEKGKDYSFLAVAVSSFAALAAVCMLSYIGLIPWLAGIAFAVLCLRAVFGMSRFRKRSKAVRIGIGEIVYGLLTVFLVIVGYYVDS